MKQLKLVGNSQFDVTLKYQDDKFMVVKKVTDSKDQDRLLSQCHKQKVFSHFVNEDLVLKHLFHVPKVYSVGSERDFSFSMEYVTGHTVLEILDRGDITELHDIHDRLWLFIDAEVKASKWQTVFRDEILKKLYDVMGKCPKGWLPIGYAIEQFISRDLALPVGVCHGDLTFANMIFNNKINLIDLLDSYIETPIQDIAKLKQEFDLVWTWEMSNRNAQDMTKIRIGYSHLKKIFDHKVKEFGFEYEIKVFYLMTLFRIVPYIKSEDVSILIESALKKELL